MKSWAVRKGGLCCIKKRRGGSVERVDVLAATAFAEATVVKKSAKSAKESVRG